MHDTWGSLVTRHRQYLAEDRSNMRLRLFWLVLVLGCLTIGLVLVITAAHLRGKFALQDLYQTNEQRLDGYQKSLQRVLDKHEHLPFMIAWNAQVGELLKHPEDPALERRVNELLDRIGWIAPEAEFYLLDTTGATLAASQSDAHGKPIGRALDFRAQVREIDAGAERSIKAFGTEAVPPGYFLFHPMRRHGRLFGYVLAAVDLRLLRRDWAGTPENLMVTDAEHRAFLTNRSDWSDAGINRLAEVMRRHLTWSWQPRSVRVRLRGFAGTEGSAGRAWRITLADSGKSKSYLAQSRSLSRPNWHLHHLKPEFPGVLVTDVRMQPVDGLALLKTALERDPELPVVLVTGHGDIAMAVQAMRDGAYDFIEKPFQPEHLIEVVRRACEKRRLVLEVRHLRQRLDAQSDIAATIIGNSSAIERLREDIACLAATDVSVLIEGETGTGKELVARCLHEHSPRRENNFVAINCGAIPEALFESELLGFEAGTFTGATRRRIGRLEHSHRGTVFLDEIESLPLNLQVKLLRVLEEGSIHRLGCNRQIEIDIRIIAATKIDLREAAEVGTFRADLYYRLNVGELFIPPLRKRRDDIPLLFENFVAKAGKTHAVEPLTLTGEDLQALLVHDWPGNVRELRNVAERYALSMNLGLRRIGELLRLSKMGVTEATEHRGRSLAARLELFERCTLEQALIRHKGNLKAVMEELGLPRRTLTHKLSRHGIKREDHLS